MVLATWQILAAHYLGILRTVGQVQRILPLLIYVGTATRTVQVCFDVGTPSLYSLFYFSCVHKHVPISKISLTFPDEVKQASDNLGHALACVAGMPVNAMALPLLLHKRLRILTVTMVKSYNNAAIGAVAGSAGYVGTKGGSTFSAHSYVAGGYYHIYYLKNYPQASDPGAIQSVMHVCNA